MRILVSDKFSEKGLEILKQTAGVEVDYRTGLKGDDLVAALSQADGLIIRSSTKVTAELMEKCPRLKAIGRAGSGVDNVDLPAAGKMGIVVMNTPGGNNVATGEHTLSMMMALSRQIPAACAALKAGRWEKSKYMGVEVFRKTLGVLGFGNVGKVVVAGALGMGMRVLVHDPFVVADKIAELGAVPATFDEVLAEADYVTVHVPKSDKTLNLINAETIAKMKTGVRIINCARGGIVNEADLLAALQSGKVAGAALDVYITEPCTESPLFALDNVVVTPHLGASTNEAQDNVAVAIVYQMIDFLQHGNIKNAVNAPKIEPELLKRIQPALKLTEKIGCLLGQLVDGAPRMLKIFLGGDFAGYPADPFAAAALVGLLPDFYDDEKINSINAPFLAKERGIAVSVTKREALTDYANVIGLEAVFEGHEVEIQASIPAPGEERIVRINQFQISLDPEGRILLISNEDVPGVVGEVGTLLGARKINIGQLRLGRMKDQAEALMAVTCDNEVGEDVLIALRELPHVLSARLVNVS
ncbi:MAG: phosphoglycerate dehydrogenase [Myxococcales bacterium]|nr:phosphoglycerate dehydrogenase [Myxococcales bacterium]